MPDHDQELQHERKGRMSDYTHKFYVMRRANIVYGATDDRGQAERMLQLAQRKHRKDRVRIIETRDA